MAIDPAIALNVIPFNEQMQKATTLAEMQLRMQALRDQTQAQNALKQLFATPGAVDAQGNLTPQAIQRVMTIDPMTGMDIRKGQLQNSELALKRQAEIQEVFDPVRTAALSAYSNAKAKGASEDAAQAAGQAAWDEGSAPIMGGGLLADDEKKRIRTKFDYPQMSAASAQWQKQQEDLRRFNVEEADRKTQIGIAGGHLALARQEAGFREKLESEEFELKKAELGKGVTWTPGTGLDPATGQQVPGVYALPKTGGEPQFHPGVVETPKGQTMTPEDQAHAAETAKMVANYQLAPPTGFALRSPYWQGVMAEVGKINPDYDVKEFNSRNKSQAAFASGPQGNIIRSLNVSIAHLDTLGDLATALHNGDVRLLNAAGNRWAEETGSPAPTNFDAAKGIVGDEIIKAVIGGGGALADRENAQNQVNRAKSPEQLAGVIETYKDLLAGQMSGLRKQYEDTTGLKNFDQRLEPATRAALENRRKAAPPKSTAPAAKAGWSIERVPDTAAPAAAPSGSDTD